MLRLFPPLNTSHVKRRKATKMQSEKCRYLFISLLAFRWQQKTLKTTNERHLQVAPTPVPLLQRLELACAALFVSCSASASASSCLHLLSDFVVVVAIHTPKLLLLHECCKSKVGESHEGSKNCSSGTDSISISGCSFCCSGSKRWWPWPRRSAYLTGRPSG